MKHTELKIPIALAKYILRDKRHPQFKVWLALKGVHGAYIKKSDLNKTRVARLCGFSTSKTVDYHLKKLLAFNWVGEDEQHYFFRPISYLCDTCNVKSGKGHIIDLTKELPEIQSLLFAIAVKNLTNYRKFLGRKNGYRHKQGGSGYQIQYYNAHTVSVRLFARLIGISINMVHRLKKQASDIGYLQISSNSRLVLPYEHAYLHEKFYERLYVGCNAWRIRLTDEVKSLILTK